MRRADYFSGLWIESSLLDYDSDSKNESILVRTKALLNSDALGSGSGSIVGRPGDSFLEVSQSTLGTLLVAAGQAIDKNGEWVNVPEDVSRVDDVGYEPVKPSRTVDLDDVGITDEGETYYFGVTYAEASGAVKSNRDGESFATRYYDTYAWSASVSPLVTPYINLAKVTLISAVGGSVSITDLRDEQWLSCQVDAREVYIDSPVLDEMETLQDHVDMIYDDDLVSSTNPHGVSSVPYFDEMVNAPTGLEGGKRHGVEAHDSSVPIARISSMNYAESSLSPTLYGGGIIWVDGYYDYDDDGSEYKTLDNNIDWRFRWITVKGFTKLSADADDYIPEGTKNGEIMGRLNPVIGEPSNINYGQFYSGSGSAGGTPCVYLKEISGANQAVMSVYASNSGSGSLRAKVSTWPSSPSGYKYAFGLAIEYGPRRSNNS